MRRKLFSLAAGVSAVLHAGVWLVGFNLCYIYPLPFPPQAGWASTQPGWAELFGWRISDESFEAAGRAVVPALALTAILPLSWGIVFAAVVLRASRRDRSGYCARCGYVLRATPDRCPECGVVPRAAKGEGACDATSSRSRRGCRR